MRPILSHSIAVFAGIGGAAAILLAPPIFTGPTPPETPGMTCETVKTGILTGEQVCTFGFVTDGGVGSEPAFGPPPQTGVLPVDVDGGTMDPPVPTPTEPPVSHRPKPHLPEER